MQVRVQGQDIARGQTVMAVEKTCSPVHSQDKVFALAMEFQHGGVSEFVPFGGKAPWVKWIFTFSGKD